MNRLLILVALLAVLMAGCGTEQPSPSEAATTQEATPQAASEAPAPSVEPEPSDEPAASEDAGGAIGSLDDVIPDDLNGVAGTPVPGMDQILGAALQGQGLNAGDAEFAFVTYGDGVDATVLNAFRIPGLNDTAMEQLAQVMAGVGANQEVDVETIDVGGKTVLSFSGGATDGVVYFYVADGIAFTVAGQDAGLVEQLLSELP